MIPDTTPGAADEPDRIGRLVSGSDTWIDNSLDKERIDTRLMQQSHVLDTTDLFAAMPDDVRGRLRANATRRTLTRGETLFHQHDPSSSLFVIAKGRVAVVAQSGDRESVLAVLEDGDLFGELAMFTQSPRSAGVRALIHTTVIEIGYQPIRSVLDERPELLWIILRLLAERLRSTDAILADVMYLDLPARTSKRLLEMAGVDDEFTLPVTQEDLASMVGASRERVNKAIAGFVRAGWLEIEGRNRYRILDRTALQHRADA
jgi:CRP-like cAMP-binding protein